MSLSITVLGCGNMAQALVGSMYKSHSDFSVFTYTPTQTRAAELANQTSGNTLENLNELPETDYLMLACKPQQFKALASEIRGKLSEKTVVLSILAGVNMQTLQSELNHQKIVRIMPNTPALVGAGVNAFYFDNSIEESLKQRTLELFEDFSEVFVFDSEELVDTITPFSGSGPAYFFELARIMIDELVSKGVSEEEASRMIKATAFGAGKLLVQSSDSAETLRNKVTSKGGVTYEALKVFADNDLQGITHKALEAALKRNKELSQA